MFYLRPFILRARLPISLKRSIVGGYGYWGKTEEEIPGSREFGGVLVRFSQWSWSRKSTRGGESDSCDDLDLSGRTWKNIGLKRLDYFNRYVLSDLNIVHVILNQGLIHSS